MSPHPEPLLISAIVNSGDYITHTHQGITSEHFHTHSDEWDWLEQYLAEHRQTPPRSTVQIEFPDFRILKVTDVAHWSQAVKAAHTNFLMRVTMGDALDLLGSDMDQAIAILSGGLSTVTASLNGYTGAISLSDDLVHTELKRREASRRGGVLPGVPSGFPSLDTASQGFHPGDYVVVGARLSEGKTWSLVSMARDAVLSGRRVLFVSLEMSATQIGLRYHCLLSSEIGSGPLNLTQLSMGGANPAHLAFLAAKKTHVAPDLFHIYDKTHGQMTIADLRREIEHVQPAVVFIDYLTLMDYRDKDWAAVAKLSNEIQAIAGRYQIPIVTAAQMNREAEGKQPSASNLSLSDSIGQDADIVMSLRMLSRSVIRAKLVKHRNGASQITWHIELNPNRGLYREITSDKAQRLVEDDMATD